jgi:pseudouridine-5'-phosphate glycosidase
MEHTFPLDVRPEVAEALRDGRPVVALSTSPIAHSLPWPTNREATREVEAAVRQEGAVPAALAVWEGRPTVGLSMAELEELAQGKSVFKASRRDLPTAVLQGCTAATTVAANMYLAWRAGIRLLVTGGIGGVGRASNEAWDISADLIELSRTPVAVVCAGAKGILDLERTVQTLESYEVPVVGYATNTFPAFYVRDTSHTLSARVDTPAEAATFISAHWALDGSGVLLAHPAPPDVALDPAQYANNLLEVERQAARVQSKDLTPFLTNRLARLTKGKTLQTYKAILVANATLAARIAGQLVEKSRPPATGK